MAGTIRQINVKPQTPGEHGLPKKPVANATVTHSGVQGDFNLYRHEKRKDDPDMALLVMPIEMIRELNHEGWPIRPGDLGENFTTEGIPYSSFGVGKVFRAGGVRFQISKACDPCDNLYLLPYVGEKNGPSFLKIMLHRRGWYARVIDEGEVTQGDDVAEVAQDSGSISAK